MSEFRVIKVFDNVSELGVVKSYLDSEGIRSFAKDEYVAQTCIPSAVGGIKLIVLEEDAEKATELLIAGGFAKKEDFEVSEPAECIVKIHAKIRSFFGCKDK